ncbi:MAG: glucosaminidase domain-containing protein [Myxococcales bacterium]|nr:glucosaminidase domain-containing protein [Myxococcales bacterium]
MSPNDATRYLADAWERLSGERPTEEVISVLWGQWALETGRGRWMVDYNYAGLKGRAPDGGTANWYTWEEEEGGSRRIRSRFRSYEAPEHGALDYVEMLLRRYPKAAAAAKRGDALNYVLELDQGGFFTERPEHYIRSVVSLAREFRRDGYAVLFRE